MLLLTFVFQNMRIFYGLEGVNKISKPVVTIGTFDGVHLGHQKIIENLKNKANEIGGESVIITFSPHPRMVLFPDSHNLRLIQTEEEKYKKLELTGIDNLIVYPFTFDFSRISAMEFVRDFLVNKLNIHTIVIGYDHQFGRNREGNIHYLKEVSSIYDFHAIEIPAKEIDEVNISSTKIRNAIADGHIEIANQFLGSPFEMQGTVVQGNQLGRKIGFPTANLLLTDNYKIIPGDGVYVVRVKYNELLYNGIMNIGLRPTIEENLEKRVEIHIFDFKQDIYNKSLEIQLLKKIRDEFKFDSIESLKNQIQHDKNFALHYFASFLH
jgi:riboflavin kinase/FMN adenylyltransferase